MRRYAISDIHGCARTFEALLDTIQLSPSDELFLLGDYIDRGPDSKGVIDLILKLQEEGYQLRCLRGNHEELLLDSLGGLMGEREIWLSNGGEQALESFGLGPQADPKEIPEQYLHFCEELDWYAETDGYLLVHAGLDFRAGNPLEAKTALVWIRDWYSQIDLGWLNGRIIVHGHTPRPRPLIEKQAGRLSKTQVINIDAGCVFPSHYLNQLCAFCLDSRELFFQKNIEDG